MRKGDTTRFFTRGQIVASGLMSIAHGFLKYIDYDLDVKLFPDETIKELDEQEFERHVLTYGYSPELTNAVKKSFSAIKDRMRDNLFPFNEKDVRILYQKFLDENHPFILLQGDKKN